MRETGERELKTKLTKAAQEFLRREGVERTEIIRRCTESQYEDSQLFYLLRRYHLKSGRVVTEERNYTIGMFSGYNTIYVELCDDGGCRAIEETEWSHNDPDIEYEVICHSQVGSQKSLCLVFPDKLALNFKRTESGFVPAGELAGKMMDAIARTTVAVDNIHIDGRGFYVSLPKGLVWNEDMLGQIKAAMKSVKPEIVFLNPKDLECH